jgi:DNA-binding MarR family transcriptional regulator
MEAAGYVERTVDTGDARQRAVTLTARGRDLLDAVEVIYGRLERQWAERIGAANVERLRRDLMKVLVTEDGTLPPVRPTW